MIFMVPGMEVGRLLRGQMDEKSISTREAFLALGFQGFGWLLEAKLGASCPPKKSKKIYFKRPREGVAFVKAS